MGEYRGQNVISIYNYMPGPATKPIILYSDSVVAVPRELPIYINYIYYYGNTTKTKSTPHDKYRLGRGSLLATGGVMKVPPPFLF